MCLHFASSISQTSCGFSFYQVPLTLVFIVFVSVAQGSWSISLRAKSSPMSVFPSKFYWNTQLHPFVYKLSLADSGSVTSLGQKPSDLQPSMLTVWTFAGRGGPPLPQPNSLRSFLLLLTLGCLSIFLVSLHLVPCIFNTLNGFLFLLASTTKYRG